MDYTYFGAGAQQPFNPHHFMGMPGNQFPHTGADAESMHTTVRPSSHRSCDRCSLGTPQRGLMRHAQEALDPTLFPTSYDAFVFNGLPTPHQGGSPDLPVAQTPMLAGSVDSGLGADMDDAAGRTRSSSEEKESLTPAQSRRKAQNRAA